MHDTRLMHDTIIKY